ncbi:MAG: glycosyltransferase, family [Rhodospirillales bacterium]|jgi:glycosyltransferase involved in cell wall biosynthesis|nr:glycosyltransferase, family [Rhodospirillales bacterium]
MKVAYVYELNAEDVTVQSGYPHAILHEMRGRNCDVVPAFPLDQGAQRRFLWKKIAYRAAGQIYRADRERAVLEDLAAQARICISDANVDCVFGPGSHAIARLETKRPVIFCADATFRNVLDFYEDFTRCAPEYVRQGEEQERAALQTAAAAIYTSEWAASSAIEDYGADPGKVHVVPFGANIVAKPFEDVKCYIANRSTKTMNVLFIGREWRRKGLPKVIATCRWLRRHGIDVALDIVGAEGYRGELPEFARFHGMMNKSKPHHRERLEAMMAQAHFLFVPSSAENFGIVFCEAAAYGIPSIATRVGGIPSIIQDNVTGVCLPPDSSAEEFGRTMLEIFGDRRRYEAMALRSYDEYATRLNWRAFGDRCLQIMTDLLA